MCDLEEVTPILRQATIGGWTFVRERHHVKIQQTEAAAAGRPYIVHIFDADLFANALTVLFDPGELLEKGVWDVAQASRRLLRGRTFEPGERSMVIVSWKDREATTMRFTRLRFPPDPGAYIAVEADFVLQAIYGEDYADLARGLAPDATIIDLTAEKLNGPG